MGPIFHVGLTAFSLSIANFFGYNISQQVFLVSLAGGVLIDSDKIIEKVNKKTRIEKGEAPDITARCRIFHSFFALPFGLTLSLMAHSWFPFFAVLLHIAADSFIPAVKKSGKYYPSHSPLKWLAIPFIKRSWKTVTLGWPVTYPPEITWVYQKLSLMGGMGFLIFAIFFWLIAD